MTYKEIVEGLPKEVNTEYRKPREAQAFQAGIEWVLKYIESMEAR